MLLVVQCLTCEHSNDARPLRVPGNDIGRGIRVFTGALQEGGAVMVCCKPISVILWAGNNAVDYGIVWTSCCNMMHTLLLAQVQGLQLSYLSQQLIAAVAASHCQMERTVCSHWLVAAICCCGNSPASGCGRQLA